MSIENILLAVQSILNLQTMTLMAIGVFAGLIAGAIPGFTITMAVVLTLPFTFGMTPINGLATMVGVFVGGLSGGLMASILTGIPGTPSSIATTFDGFPMAKAGRPGFALGLGVWSSFFGGMISSLFLMTAAAGLARIGLEFGPWDYFALIFFALTITATLAGDNLLKGVIAGVIGLLVTTVGEDQTEGIARFTFGIDALKQGFAFLPVLVGLFAFSQLLSDIKNASLVQGTILDRRSANVRIEHWQAIKTIFHHRVTLLRSSLIGVFIGVLPAAGASVANILAYDQAKRFSKTPEKFGTGTPEGVIAPESSNNATAGGDIMTTIALGIPGDIVTAIMLGALIIHNVAPSPTFISTQPVLAYGIMLSYLIAHFIMVCEQSVCLRAFVLVTRVPYYQLAAVILAYCAFGVFALNNIVFDLWALFWFGLLGYIMVQFGFPIAPMILGVVLGDSAEVNLIRALASSTDLTLFVTRPWSLFFLTIAAFSIVYPWYQKGRGRARWTLLYVPALTVCAAIPMFMMSGIVRPSIGVVLFLAGSIMFWRRHRDGWRLPPAASGTPSASGG